MSPLPVVVLSVKPLRPTVTGARVLFDNIVRYLAADEGFDLEVLVAGPLSADETAATAEIGEHVSVTASPSPKRRRNLRSLLIERPPLRLRFGWFEDAAQRFRAVLADEDERARLRPVTVALGIDSAAALARTAPVDLVVVPSMEADAPGFAAPGLAARPIGRLAERVLVSYDRRARARLERRVLRGVQLVAVSTQSDADAVARISPGVEVEVIPHGVPSHIGTGAGQTHKPADQHGLLVGSLTYGPNFQAVAMAAEVMAAVRRTHPHLELLVAGQLPSGVSPGQAWPGVRLLGRVDDLASAYARSAFVLAPLTAGGGGRIKVIEALASGVPVITTSLGASGLPGEVAAHLWVADDVAGLAEAVADVVADPIAAGETAETGRRLVEASLGEEAMARRWARLVNSVAENRSVSNNP